MRLIAALMLLVAFDVSAQTACTVGGQTTCFDADKKTGESPLTTAVVWNVVGATSCAAGGAGTGTAWNGSIPCSGTRTLSGITVKRTLTIDPVAAPTAGKMTLRFIKPIKNTDNSTLTNLAGYVVSYGTSASTLNQTVTIPLASVQSLTPTATELWDSVYTISNLAAGTWFAALQSTTTACFPTTLADCHTSVQSGTVSKAVTTTPGGNLPQLSVVIEPYTVPNPPSNLTATDVTAMEIRPNSTGTLVASRVGLVPLGTRCYEDKRTAAGVTYNGVPIELVDMVNWPIASNLREAWAKCGA